MTRGRHRRNPPAWMLISLSTLSGALVIASGAALWVGTWDTTPAAASPLPTVQRADDPGARGARFPRAITPTVVPTDAPVREPDDGPVLAPGQARLPAPTVTPRPAPVAAPTRTPAPAPAPAPIVGLPAVPVTPAQPVEEPAEEPEPVPIVPVVPDVEPEQPTEPTEPVADPPADETETVDPPLVVLP